MDAFNSVDLTDVKLHISAMLQAKAGYQLRIHQITKKAARMIRIVQPES
jgi:hypothetical protein